MNLHIWCTLSMMQVFFYLNKQLNEEAASLDWTKSRCHMLGGPIIFDSYEDEFILEPDTIAVGHRLGGESSSLASVCALSGAAAYQRFLNASAADFESSQNRVISSSKDDHVPCTEAERNQDFVQGNAKLGPDPDDQDAMHVGLMIRTSVSLGSRSFVEQHTIGYSEPDPDDSSDVNIPNQEVTIDGWHHREHDPDNGTSEFALESGNKMEVESELRSNITVSNSEPDPDDSSNAILNQDRSIDAKYSGEPDPDDTTCRAVLESGNEMEVVTEQSRNSTILKSEPDTYVQTGDSNSNELQRIEEPVAALCARLRKATEMLRLQATSAEADSAIQTLFKIPSHLPHLQSNPHFQRSAANYKGVTVTSISSTH